MTYVIFYGFLEKYLCAMGNCTELQSRQLKDFESLSNEAKLELLRTAESISIPKGKVIFKENQPLHKLYCIKRGACKFSKVDNIGQEHVLRFLGKGEIMGKRSLLTNNGAEVSAVALSDTELCCLDKNAFLKSLKENPGFFQDFLDVLIEDVNINEYTRIIFCVHKGIKQRLAHLLVYLLKKYGADRNGRLWVRLKREDMATVLGTSPEYVINLLTNFKNAGLINTVRSEIHVLSKEGLERIGNS